MIKKEIKTLYLTAGKYSDIECSVPTSVCSAYLASGYIEDPYFDKNILMTNDLLPKAASFVAKIDFSAAEASKKHIYLSLKGVSAKAEVFFNDRSQGLMSNVNANYVFDVTDRVKEGENTLRINCTEPILRKNILSSSGEVSGEYDMPPVLSDIAVLCRPEILMTDSALVSGVTLSQEHGEGRVNVIVKPEILGSDDDVRIVASLMSPSGKIYFGGIYEDGIKITVPDPELWWPRGFGAPSLYKLSVTLYHGADVADTYERRIGLRTIDLKSEENGAPAVIVNGTKIFSSGAVYVRESSILSGVSKEKTEALLNSVISRNMNTLTVFDEGIALPDSFYDACDKKGILVWQSLSVPYIAPPAAGVFAAGLTDAIDDTVKRFAIHPSVALMFISITESERGGMRIYPDAIEEFRAVTMRIIGPVLKFGAPNTVVLSNPDKLFGHDERYASCSDAKASGKALYSLPTELTMVSIAREGDVNLFSKAVELHTAITDACQNMIISISKNLKFPTGMSELIYATELSAAIEASRSVRCAREKSSHSMSAALRQLNDGWQCVSSSMIDSFGREKALLYYARNFFSPITVSAVSCGDEMRFTVINGTKKEFSGKLVYALHDAMGVCRFETSKEISLDKSDASEPIVADFSKYLNEEKNSHFVAYELYDSKGIIVKGTELFVPIKHFAFENPEIKAEISGSGKRFSLKLTASAFAYAARISFDGIYAAFADNFVDLIPGSPTVINFETDAVSTLGELQSKLKIITPYHMGK
ncbi:MAG: hypothetical protein IJY23_08545 [Clostridia bacterium]|nr:hypothetical protein [Clostridia bacterium]